MKSIKMGMLCLALSAVAGQTMAMGRDYEHRGGFVIKKERKQEERKQEVRPTASVPESSSLALIAAGIIGVVVARRFTK